MPAAKDVETTATGVIARPSEGLAQYLNRMADQSTTTRSFDVAASQLDKMLTATELDDILDSDEQGALQGRDLVGLELEILPIDFNTAVHHSDEKYNSPLGVYIQFEAFALIDFPSRGIKSGDHLLISTGAPLVIGKLRTMQANGFLPFRFLIAGIDGPNGTVLKLRRQPARA